jgi:predicted RNase H-like HicB family nuclease
MTTLHTGGHKVTPFVLAEQHEEPVAQGADAPEEREGTVIRWAAYEGGVYCCEVRLCEEVNGGFSACVPRLPGVASEGETREEVLENIKEALTGAIETYRDDGQPIPWKHDEAPLQSNEIARWVVVHV